MIRTHERGDLSVRSHDRADSPEDERRAAGRGSGQIRRVARRAGPGPGPVGVVGGVFDGPVRLQDRALDGRGGVVEVFAGVDGARFGHLGEQELAAGVVLAAEGAAPDECAGFGLG